MLACLINNIGLSYPRADAFVRSQIPTFEFIKKIIRINVATLTTLTRMILFKLISDPLPVHGVHRLVINLSCPSDVLSVTYLRVYGATKACVVSLTRALASELKDTCVHVPAFTPDIVATKMSKIKRTLPSRPTAEIFVECAFSMIGVETIGTGYFWHALDMHLFGSLPSGYASNHFRFQRLKYRNRSLVSLKAK
ncbi:hypothetical protein Aperf_G00000088696 [Anoplocephala perfoliata]